MYKSGAVQRPHNLIVMPTARLWHKCVTAAVVTSVA